MIYEGNFHGMDLALVNNVRNPVKTCVRIRESSLIGLIFLLCVCGSDSRAEDQTLESAGALTRFSPVETAGSHGSTGWAIGVTASEYALSAPEVAGRHKIQNPDQKTENVPLGEVQVVKGLSWPVDVGGSWAKPLGSKLERYSGYVQWTIYEALAMPALAARGMYSKLFGWNGDATRIGTQGIMSYGFLRYFTVYGGLTAEQVETRRDASENMEGRDSLAVVGEESTNPTMKWLSFSQFYGAKVLALPPSGAVGVEVTETREGERSLIAKISFGM